MNVIQLNCYSTRDTTLTQIRKLSLTYLVKSEFTNFRPSLKAISHDRDRIKRNQQSITSLVCYRINSCEYSSITDRIISYLLFLTFESEPSIVIILYLVDKKKKKKLKFTRNLSWRMKFFFSRVSLGTWEDRWTKWKCCNCQWYREEF